MNPIITAFEASPDEGQGMARDMRVRWALEEVGLPYDVRLVSFDAMKAAAHVALHPFGQIPTFEQDGLVLFESGAIVLHVAQTYPGLLPDNADARARVVAWMFAAVNTVEPPIVEREVAEYLEGDRSWHEARLALIDGRIRTRLGELSRYLGDREWLEGDFSAADVMMVHVLRRASGVGNLEAFPSLCAYIDRGEARAAYRRAFAAQLAVFEASRAQ